MKNEGATPRKASAVSGSKNSSKKQNYIDFNSRVGKTRLQADEEEQIQAEMQLLDNAEILDQKAQWISELGESEEVDIAGILNKLKITLEDLARIEPEFDQYLSEVNAARVSIIETMSFAEQYRNRIEFNPSRLEELRQRQAELNRLQKKYSRDIPSLIEYERTIAEELSVAENFDLALERIDQIIDEHEHVLAKAAVELHNARRNTRSASTFYRNRTSSVGNTTCAATGSGIGFMTLWMV